jgi:hypothetical protein
LPRSACALALALSTALVATARAQEPPPEVAPAEADKVVRRTPSGGYTIDAFETNIVQVLTEVGDQAGFTVQAPDNFHSPLTLSAENLPLDQLLRRVLRNENYIIVYRGGVRKTAISGDAIDKIFLLSQASSAPAPRQAGPAGASPLAGPGAKPNPRAQPAPAGAPAPGVAGSEGDVAARAERARARAEARRAAAQGAMPPAPPGPAPVPPDGTAHMVETPEDVTPPADVPAEDAPGPVAGDLPADVLPDGSVVEQVPDEY